MEQLLKDFETHTAALQNYFAAMTEQMDAGLVPDAACLRGVNEAWTSLKNCYDEIRAAALGLCSEPLPEEMLPVKEYARLAAESCRLRMEQTRSAAVQVLQKFLRVKADQPTFAAALEPYQQQSAALLEALAAPDAEIPDVDGQKFFLQLLESADLDEAERESLLEKVDPYFSAKVSRGLDRGYYYLPKDAGEAAPAQPAAAQEAPVPAPAPVAEGAAAAPADVTAAPAQEPAAPAEEEAGPAAGAAEEAPEPAPEQEAAPAPEKAAPAPQQEAMPATVKPLKPIKQSTPSASSLKKELKGLGAGAYFIFPLLSKLGLLSEQQIVDCGRLLHVAERQSKPAVVASSLEAMTARGYLSKYRLPDHEEPLFCYSPYGAGCVKKESSLQRLREQAQIEFGEFPFLAQDELPEADLTLYARQCGALLPLLQRVAAGAPAELPAVWDSLTWEPDGYLLCAPGTAVVCRLTQAADLPQYAQDLPPFLAEEALPAPEAMGDIPQAYAFTGQLCHWAEGAWGGDEAARGEADAEPAQSGEAGSAAEALPAAAQSPAPEAVPGEEDTPAEGSPADGPDAPDEEEEPAEGSDRVGVPDPDESCCTPQKMAQYYLDACRQNRYPTHRQLQQIVYALLACEGAQETSEKGDIVLIYDPVIEAVMLACTAALLEEPADLRLYHQLLAAFGLPEIQIQQDAHDLSLYNGEVLNGLFDTSDPDTRPMMLAAYMQAMLFPARAYDPTLRAQTELCNKEYDTIFGAYPQLKRLFSMLRDFQTSDLAPSGFTASILGQLVNAEQREKRIAGIRLRANDLIDAPKTKTPINGLAAMATACFGINSDLQTCMLLIAENKRGEADIETVSMVLEEFCQAEEDAGSGVYLLDNEKIKEYLRNEWSKARKDRLQLNYQARGQMERNLRERLNVIKDWLVLVKAPRLRGLDTLRTHHAKIRSEIQNALSDLNAQYSRERRWDTAVLRCALEKIKARLENQEERPAYVGMLRSGYFSLDNDFSPVVDKALANVRYAEPWRLMLWHIAKPVCSLKEVTAQIFDGKASEARDNLRQLQHINALCGSSESIVASDARRTAEEQAAELKNDLELAYTYGRFNEDEKEILLNIMEQSRDRLFDQQDYGCWHILLRALRDQMDDITNSNHSRLRRTLDGCRRSPDGNCALLNAAEELLEQKQNFSVAEEYINRFEQGERSITTSTEMLESDSYFDRFLKNYEAIYKYCLDYKRGDFPAFAFNYVKESFRGSGESWSQDFQDDVRSFFSAWPLRGSEAGGPGREQQIKNLLCAWQFDVRDIALHPGAGEEQYVVTVAPAPKNYVAYPHPIRQFGTEMRRKLYVVCLNGDRTAQVLIDTIVRMNLTEPVIVLLDTAMELLNGRRKLAEAYFRKSMNNRQPFLFIDRVLMLYLGTLPSNQRLPAMLQCTLPFTYLQPFTDSDAGTTSDEMFFGRKEELESITNFTGASLVYGGRQLGKTALLQRAASLCHVPEEKQWAIFISLNRTRSSEADVTDLIWTQLKNAGVPIAARPAGADTLQALCNALEPLLRSGQVSCLLLLLDETDAFLETLSKEKYTALQPLIDLKRNYSNRFKFVLAGLHNVSRAREATERNGGLSQLGTALCIRPLKPLDAQRLLLYPLRYLGFRIGNDLHLETLLTNTNYYPGILQFFGATLVKTLTDNYSSYYSAAKGNPPFELEEKQLRVVLGKSALQESIQSRLLMSLVLDPRYFMLAGCIAMLYYYGNESDDGHFYGFTVQEIRDIADMLDISMVTLLEDNDLALLLNEMEEMGILMSSQGKAQRTYRLRRYNFIDVLGKNPDLIEKNIRDAQKHYEQGGQP